MPWALEQVTAGRMNPVAAFLATLQPKDREQIAARLVLLAERGNLLGLPHSKALGDGLFELRTKSGVRLFYTFRPGQRVVLLGGIVKKRDDIPKDVITQMRERAARVP